MHGSVKRASMWRSMAEEHVFLSYISVALLDSDYDRCTVGRCK